MMKQKKKVISCLKELGYGINSLIDSPITGSKGNKEFLINFQRKDK